MSASAKAWQAFLDGLDKLGVKFDDVRSCSEAPRAKLLSDMGLSPIQVALVDSLWSQGGPRLQAADKLKARKSSADPNSATMQLPQGNPFTARKHTAQQRDHQLVWGAVGECTAQHVKEVIAAAKARGDSVHINTGTHGSSCGLTVTEDTSMADAVFMMQDFKLAEKEANVSIHIVSSLAPAIFPPGANHIVLAWCHSSKFAIPAPPKNERVADFVVEQQKNDNSSGVEGSDGQQQYLMTVGTFKPSDLIEKPAQNQQKKAEEVIYYPDGGEYRGTTLDGKRHGVGRLEFGSGSVYMGEFVKSNFHGTGVFIDAWEETKFEGIFKNGQKHGKGVLRKLSDGSVIHRGMWEDDEFVEQKK